MFPSTTKFLLVDDFPTMRKIIKKVLNDLGYTQVEEAEDGRSALPLLKAAHDSGQPFQFIICDSNMPGMQGIDVLKACKADPRLKMIPFMLMTAESEQKNKMESAKAGASDYVVKPFNSTTLRTKLERIFQKHYPSQEPKAS